MRIRGISLVMAAGLALGACGGRQSTLVEAAPAPVKVGDATLKLQEASDHWAKREDKNAVLAAISAWEQAEALDPTDAQIPLKLTYAYYFLANAHLVWEEDEDGMKAAYDKGVTAGEKAIKLLSPAFAEQIRNGKPWEVAIPSVDKAGLPALYWYATNLGRWATLDGITTLLSNKDRVFAIMEHCLKLDETYFHGAPHRYFGVAYTKIPFPNGDLPRSRKAFERAIEIDRNYADTRVLFAESYASKAGDKELYLKLVNEVIAMPDDILPELVPETRNAKRKAAKMLEDAADLF
ncbi:TRAP transporter TatT component family protein [Myxococcota bacterium]|jgi:tetratricopeptide (TPR) repeat protein|nr:TRAP transporter TatT component family protein [Myxococcota bacterium]